MNNIFKYNVSNINKNYSFFLNGVSTASNPLDNTLIFVNKNKDEYFEKLSTIKEAVIILLSDIEKEKKSKNYQEKDFVGVTNESIANLLGGLTGNEWSRV